MESCLYQGVVRHERLEPVIHRFQYGLYMTFLDLAEVPSLLRAGLLSESRFAPGAFLRRDHLGDPRQSLAASVRDLVSQQTGLKLEGPVRLLTQLRNFGYYFNPLSIYYCLAADGCTVEALVAEVQNTPWLERHCYVLWHGNQHGAGADLQYRHPKVFHVSPFMDMNLEYRWRLSSPGAQIRVGIENALEENTLFRASLHLGRVPLSRRTRLAMHCRYPLMTVRITAAIYLQAFHLWRTKCPFYPHPERYPRATSLATADQPRVRDGSLASSGTG
ncbi:MAG: DUF1365 domain-containing protein [Planctomycetes bacterium]|nr:DUF1365 domain-containing protein [Planctomycetota bacterium]